MTLKQPVESIRRALARQAKARCGLTIQIWQPVEGPNLL